MLCNAPTDIASIEGNNTLYTHLYTVQLLKGNIMMMTGDLNSKVGSDGTLFKDDIRRCDLGDNKNS